MAGIMFSDQEMFSIRISIEKELADVLYNVEMCKAILSRLKSPQPVRSVVVDQELTLSLVKPSTHPFVHRKPGRPRKNVLEPGSIVKRHYPIPKE